MKQSGINVDPEVIYDISLFPQFSRKLDNSIISLEKLVAEIFKMEMPPFHSAVKILKDFMILIPSFKVVRCKSDTLSFQII
ncbi:MAG: hypothetical protein EOP00_24325 [Pedobacter sp.]|nr:MAG: hypothetical protein EOP00_24325 [Pedobacter sp.]